MTHERPKSAIGEVCTMCKKDAYHKVGEEFLYDDLHVDEFTHVKHPMTAYICCGCFRKIFNLKECTI